MKIARKAALLLLSTLACAPVHAQPDAARLLDTARCHACHQQTEASLGPSWTAIAARHAARRDVMVDVLAGKIVRGGGGNWGLVPMVPNQWVSLEEARVMATWIMDQGSAAER
jgi:cytochrome c